MKKKNTTTWTVWETKNKLYLKGKVVSPYPTLPLAYISRRLPTTKTSGKFWEELYSGHKLNSYKLMNEVMEIKIVSLLPCIHLI